MILMLITKCSGEVSSELNLMTVGTLLEGIIVGEVMKEDVVIRNDATRMTVLSTSDFHTKQCSRKKRDCKKTNKKKRKHKHHNRFEEQDKNEKSESRQRIPLPSEPNKLWLYPMGKPPKNQSNT
jgi:hypothetical protein